MTMTTGRAATIAVHLDDATFDAELRREARAGLTAKRRWLAPTWLYDQRGCALFEAITELPEYYPTRTERGILAQRAGDIARLSGADTLVELGSGTSEKTHLLLDALAPRRADRVERVEGSVQQRWVRLHQRRVGRVASLDMRDERR